MKSGIKGLIEKQSLTSNFEIPNTAAPLEVTIDINQRSIYVGMNIGAPQDKKSSKARLNWLLRQLKNSDIKDCYIRANWPGSSAPTSHLISDLLENPDLISIDKEHLVVTSFTVFGSYHLARRFAQPSNFISDVEQLVPRFYADIGENLIQWKPPSPKIKKDKNDAQVEAIARDAEEF